MNQKHKKKIIFVTVTLSCLFASIGFALYALKQNIDVFFSPTQVENQKQITQHEIRIGGLVKQDSIHHSKTSLDVTFVLTDLRNDIKVNYNGVLPNLFREGQGIIAEGYLEDKKHFKATRVLAKHDEKYMPKEVAEMLKSKT